MIIWVPDLDHRSGPIYLAIADALASDVESGRLQPGERLPTQRQLAGRLEVNVMTVSRAYKEAARRGLVEGEVGRGTFVRRRESAGTRLEPLAPEGPELIDFHFNLPAAEPAILDVEAALAGVAADAGRLLFSGYTATGLAAHRAAGARWLRRFGVEADAERTLVCGGGQHAMTLAFATLTRPGDLVLTEELTYPGMKALANVLGLRLQGLPIDGEGLLPDAFEAACGRGGVKVLYTMPTVHNPTGTVLTAERRRQVAETARRHGVAIVEDGTYGYLLNDPPALASFAPELAYFLASTAKSLAPGLRIGYLLAPQSGTATALAMERLAANVAATSWMAAPLMAELASRWMADGCALRMLEWKRREALLRRRLFDRKIRWGTTDSDPRGSHVWLRLPAPWRCADFVAQARRRGVAVTPAEAFVVGRAEAPHAVRLSLGTPADRRDVEQGLDVLAELLAGPPEVGRAIV